MSHKPTDDTIAQVYDLRCTGVSQEAIAESIGITAKTLRAHYRETLDRAASQAHAKVIKFLFSVASGEALQDGATYADCIRAAMFYLKTQCGWRETEIAANDYELPPRRVVVVTQSADEFYNEENAK